MSLRFRTCDVFTEQRYSGNPLAVVYGADGLSGEAMQRIAREFALSETIFIHAPKDAANTARVRIFTSTSELPFAGHPTIGAAILLAEEAMGKTEFETVITLEEKAGNVPVTVKRHAGLTHATLTAPVIPMALAAPVTVGETARALGIQDDDIGFGTHHIGMAEAGPRFVFVPVATLDALRHATPGSDAFSSLMNACKTAELYVYTKGENGADYQARMFAPGIGIPEDPATGAATVCLAAHLDACGMVQDGTTDWTLHQGIEMGRPSQLALKINRAGGALRSVQVGGSAVGIMEGTLEPPAE